MGDQVKEQPQESLENPGRIYTLVEVEELHIHITIPPVELVEDGAVLEVLF